MQDRVPLYPGRVTLTPVAGQENTYDMVRADQPTKEGTPLNKATFLKDTTAALFGLGTTAVPDDVFQMLAIMPGRYKIGVHVTVNGTAASGVTVHGITNANGGAVSTNSAGYAEGYTYERTATLSVDKQYTDVPAKTVTVNTNGNAFTETTIALVSTSGQLEVTSSQMVRFSTAVKTVDIFAVGGGGSGAVHAATNAAASGGAGGYTKTQLGVTVVANQVVCTIGAGGAARTISAGKTGASSGAAGGTTSAKTGSVTVTANGGSGGTLGTGTNGGSGSGGTDSLNNAVGTGGSNGSAGGVGGNYAGGTGQGTTTTAFGSGTGTKYSGAGAGAAASFSYDRDCLGAPGSDGGGDAYSGYYNRYPISAVTAGSATVPGSGGGAVAIAAGNTSSSSAVYSSGAGADGLVILRW